MSRRCSLGWTVAVTTGPAGLSIGYPSFSADKPFLFPSSGLLSRCFIFPLYSPDLSHLNPSAKAPACRTGGGGPALRKGAPSQHGTKTTAFFLERCHSQASLETELINPSPPPLMPKAGKECKNHCATTNNPPSVASEREEAVVYQSAPLRTGPTNLESLIPN